MNYKTKTINPVNDFAIIELAGGQYRVREGDTIKTQKIKNVQTDSSITIDKVLLLKNGEGIEIGQPYITGAKVEARVLSEGRDKKIIVFRYHSKTRHRKKKGHRQQYTKLQITNITS